MLGAMNNLFDQNHIKNMHIIINDFEQARSLYGYGYDGYGYDGYGYGYGSDGYGYYEEEKKS
jgi:squalene cyclase